MAKESDDEIIMKAPEDASVSKGKKKMDEGDEKGHDDGFEFSFQFAIFPESPVSADVAFFEWKMKQLFPVRRSDEIVLVTEIVTEEVASNVGRSRRSRGRKPLGELMKLEKELAFPIDADEIEAVAVGPYCVWKPPAEKKSTKTRSPKRWCRLRDLLRRDEESMHRESAGESSAVADGVGRRRRDISCHLCSGHPQYMPELQREVTSLEP